MVALRFGLAAFPLMATHTAALGPTHGVVVGDVTHSQATVWSRSDEDSTMQASIYPCSAREAGEEIKGEVGVTFSQDYTGLVDFSGLTPETCYEVEVVFTALDGGTAESTPAYSTFDTPPLPSVMRPVRFAWGGDISGQNVCRDAAEGFPVMEAMNSVQGKDFFLNVGDAIYGDSVCRDVGLGQNAQVEGDFQRSADLENFWAHWRYNLEDPGYQTLLSSQAFFMTWDDHEVVNDFGPGDDTRDTGVYNAGESLMPIGMQAFLNYNPIRATVDPTEPLAFYRTVRWGAAVELFILDTRQYRSLATDEDTASTPKTMLGATQLAWLKESMTASTALWKMVVTSVPLSIPTGAGDDARDGWANFEGNTGYEQELAEILAHMRDGEMHNTVFITADVHFAQCIRYQPFGSDTDFDFHEIIVGPLNAGPFNRPDLDQTFSPERLFYYAPEQSTANRNRNYDYAEGIRPYFNFGVADIDASGNLTFSIINTDNEVLFTLSLAPREDTVMPGVSPAPAPTPVSTPSPVSRPAPVEPTPVTTYQCSNGVEGIEATNGRGSVCCPVDCGVCGGSGCRRAPGGKDECCIPGILNYPQPLCSETHTAPCIIFDEQVEEEEEEEEEGTALSFVCEGAAGVLQGDICCEASCGTCGGVGCSKRGNGKLSCCTSYIRTAGKTCSVLDGAPCIVAPDVEAADIAAANIVAAVPNFEEIGCFTDKGGAERIKTNLIVSSEMTVEFCQEHCDGSIYFGVQYGEECWCDTAQGDTNYRFDMHGSSTSCTMPCSGDASEICGGRWGMSVYKNL